jgi:hypothetical protein
MISPPQDYSHFPVVRKPLWLVAKNLLFRKPREADFWLQVIFTNLALKLAGEFVSPPFLKLIPVNYLRAKFVEDKWERKVSNVCCAVFPPSVHLPLPSI